MAAATDTETEQQALDTFLAAAKGVLATEGATEAGLHAIAQGMAALVRHPAILANADAPAGNVHAGRQTGPLYTDDTGLTLVRAGFGPERLTPIHNHGTWGVVGLYRGRDRYQRWRRLDDGTGDGAARLALVDERVLEPGDVAIIPPPPQDIHAQGGEGGWCYEFVLFGANAMHIPRLYFDTTANMATLQGIKGA